MRHVLATRGVDEDYSSPPPWPFIEHRPRGRKMKGLAIFPVDAGDECHRAGEGEKDHQKEDRGATWWDPVEGTGQHDKHGGQKRRPERDRKRGSLRVKEEKKAVGRERHEGRRPGQRA